MFEELLEKKEFESFVKHHLNEIPATLKEKPCCLGVDEAGRGPVLGPMVYGIAFCPIDRQTELREQGMDGNSIPLIEDSKKLSADSRNELLKKTQDMEEWLGWSVHALSAREISECMLRRQKHNLNALSHETAIGLIRGALARGVNVQEVYVDTVGSPEKYQEILKKEFKQIKKIAVAKKADSLYPVVSAASICAKVVRDFLLENWKFAETCFANTDKSLLGSGYPSDPATKIWLNENINQIFGFPRLIRFSWSTCGNLLLTSASKVHWPYEDEEQESSPPNKRIKTIDPKKLINEPAPGRGSLFKSLNLSCVNFLEH